MRGHLALPEKVEQSVCFFLTKGAKIIIFNCSLIQKGICGQTSMEKFELENNNFGTFCACSRKQKCFFPIYFFLNQNIDSLETVESFSKAFQKTKKPSNLTYRNLVATKSEKPRASQTKKKNKLLSNEKKVIANSHSSFLSA